MGKSKSVTRIETLDRKAAKAVAPYKHSLPVRAAQLLGELADQPPLATICATTLAVGLVGRDPRLTRAGGRMMVSFALATLGKALAKHAVDRTRPGVAAKRGYGSGKGERDEGPWNSFPSGHTAGALAVSRAVTREYPGVAPAATLVTAIVAAVQVPRGAHYPSDVTAGAVIGWAAETLADATFARA